MAVVYAKRKQLLERIYHPRWIIQSYVYRLEHHPIFWQYIPYCTGFTFFFNYIFIMYFDITEQIMRCRYFYKIYKQLFYVFSSTQIYEKLMYPHSQNNTCYFLVWIKKKNNLGVVLSSKHLLLIFIYLLWPRYKT